MINADGWLIRHLVCPRGRTALKEIDGFLAAETGARYPVIDGVPVFLLDDVRQTIGVARKSIERTRNALDPRAPHLYLESLGITEEEKTALVDAVKRGSQKVDPVVSALVAATNGIAYKHLIGKLDEYPIPNIPLPKSEGERLLDIGCNWGRWCVAAARSGYRPVGIDPSLGAIMAARRTCRALQVSAEFVVGDARFLPFADESFDAVFSYSVIQHFSYEDAAKAFSEAGRVLKPGGRCLIQMPNWLGARSLYHLTRRGFAAGRDFDVRYWRLSELKKQFEKHIGPTRLFVDCFFGLGLQKSDLGMMPPFKRAAIEISEALKSASRKLPFLLWIADSVFVESRKPGR